MAVCLFQSILLLHPWPSIGHSPPQVQRVINDEMPLPAFPVCMCLMLLAKQKRTSLPDEFLMLCCNKLSRFESLTSGHPELHGTTLLNRYAACGIGACAYIMAKQPASGRAFFSQERFDMFFQILPKLIRSQFFDAAELVSSTCRHYSMSTHLLCTNDLMELHTGDQLSVKILHQPSKNRFNAQFY